MQGHPVLPDKQGYLFKKVVKKGKGWKCSWFVLEKGIFMYYKDVKVRSPPARIPFNHALSKTFLVPCTRQRETPDGGVNLL
jgi:hypothetical protein